MPRDEELKRRVGALLVGLLVLILGMFLVRLLFGPSSAELRERAPVAVDAGAVIPGLEAQLERCRHSAAGDGGNPGWAQALADCDAVMRLSLGHREAADLAAAIRPQVACDVELETARAMRGRGEPEGAAFVLKGIVAPCSNAGLARRWENELTPELRARAAVDCQKFSEQKNWRDAFAACERYVDLTHCPGFEARITPPPGSKKGWQPEDPLLVAFLKAKSQAHKKKTWRCDSHFEFQKR